MAIRVKKIELWRCEVENRPGALASVLEGLAKAGADLLVVMGYRYPGVEPKAAVELYPVTTKKAAAAAQAAGLTASGIPTLLVEGDNRPGLGHAVTAAIAGAGINLAFLVTQVIGRKYSSVIGFEREEDAKAALPILRKAAAARKK
jgi:hypothetical protein